MTSQTKSCMEYSIPTIIFQCFFTLKFDEKISSLIHGLRLSMRFSDNWLTFLGTTLILSSCALREGESAADDEEGRHSDAKPEIVVVEIRRHQDRRRTRCSVAVDADRLAIAASSRASVIHASAQTFPVSIIVVIIGSLSAAELLHRSNVVPQWLRRRRVPDGDWCSAADARWVRAGAFLNGVWRARQLFHERSWILSLGRRYNAAYQTSAAPFHWYSNR